MPCIILTSPQGTRLIEQNTPYRLLQDEEITGIEPACGKPMDIANNVWIEYKFRHCSNCGKDGVYDST